MQRCTYEFACAVRLCLWRLVGCVYNARGVARLCCAEALSSRCLCRLLPLSFFPLAPRGRCPADASFRHAVVEMRLLIALCAHSRASQSRPSRRTVWPKGRRATDNFRTILRALVRPRLGSEAAGRRARGRDRAGAVSSCKRGSCWSGRRGARRPSSWPEMRHRGRKRQRLSC